MSHPNPVVHLELHTWDVAGASALYSELCGWRPVPVKTCAGRYLAFEFGAALSAGMVETDADHPIWLPYVEVDRLDVVGRRARLLAGEMRGAMNDRELLDQARAGDEDAFGRLVEPYRGALYGHAYRMLGSAQDAEDAVQETLLSAWRGIARFEGRSSLRSWLYRIATNASLKIIERRPRRVLPIDYGPPGDPGDPVDEPVVESVWIEPVADERLGLEGGHGSPAARYELRESVELAFIAALQHLPPRQRAVLILRDVLGFSAREAAEVLDATPASIDSALQRAHQTVDDRLPERDQQATLRTLDDAALRRVVDGYVDAWERDDADALAALLTDEAVFAMPPNALWFRGREAIAEFLRVVPMGRGNRWRLVPTRANGQLAFGHYVWSEERGAFGAHAIDVLTLDGDRIAELTVFLDPDAVARFGLPDELAE
jgi:RNA polymerase sigma-70 factor (ECF subfamily)